MYFKDKDSLIIQLLTNNPIEYKKERVLPPTSGSGMSSLTKTNTVEILEKRICFLEDTVAKLINILALRK